MVVLPKPDPKEPLVIGVRYIIRDEMRARMRQLFPTVEFIEARNDNTVPLDRATIIYGHPPAPFDRSKYPKLKFVQLSSVGIEQERKGGVANSGIPVANVSGAYSPALAELMIAMMLGLWRRFPVASRQQVKHIWGEPSGKLRGFNAFGRTLGIVGYGSIGRHMARIAHAMGMHILAMKRNPQQHAQEPYSFLLPNVGDPEGILPEAWYGLDRMEEMFSRCHAIALALPGTDGTRGMITARHLDALPQGAVILNVGRGNVLDQGHMIRLLQSGKLGGAGLDVFETEPLPADSPLWDMENVIVYPHAGTGTFERSPLAGEVLIANIQRWYAGEPLLNIVNFENGY